MFLSEIIGNENVTVKNKKNSENIFDISVTYKKNSETFSPPGNTEFVLKSRTTLLTLFYGFGNVNTTVPSNNLCTVARFFFLIKG